MSLTDVIKSIHRAGGVPSVLPLIEKSLLKESTSKDPSVWEDKMTRFHPSKIAFSGVCPRSYALFMLRESLGLRLSPPAPHENKLLRVFHHGHAIHSMYQDKILADSGCLYGFWEKDDTKIEGFKPEGEGWSYVEPRILWPEYRISGYADGLVFVDNQWVLLEIKSSNDQSFRFMKAKKEPRPYHVLQAMLYAFAPNNIEKEMNVTGCLILYVNKDTGEELDFFVEKDFSIIKDVLEQIEYSINSVEKGFIPSRVSECKSLRSKRAKDCITCHACFMKEDWNEL
jgi:hypothetical protein